MTKLPLINKSSRCSSRNGVTVFTVLSRYYKFILLSCIHSSSIGCLPRPTLSSQWHVNWNARKFGLIKQIDKDWITTVKDLESWCFSALALHSSEWWRANAQNLSLSLQIFHSGNSTFINLFDKKKFSCFTDSHRCSTIVS